MVVVTTIAKGDVCLIKIKETINWKPIVYVWVYSMCMGLFKISK